jgi:hypothetical protein
MSLARIIPLASVLMLPVPAFAANWHEPAGHAVARGHYATAPARVVVQPRSHYAAPVRAWAPAPHRNWVAAHWAWNGFRWIWQAGYWAAAAAMTPPVVVAPPPPPVYYPAPQPAYYQPQPQPQYYAPQVAPRAEMLAPGAPPPPPPA